MKKFRTFLLASLVTVAFGLMAGCGSDDPAPTPKGTVVKGPVSGAQVYDVNNVLVGTTDANGQFPLAGTGPYRTVGGKYTPLKADGTPGTPVDAPPMKAPVGVSQITPLTTLFANATPAEQTQITSTLTKLGITLNTPLNAKTTTNAAAIELNESVGAVLQAAQSTPTLTDTVTQSLITSVTSLAAGTAPIDATAITQAVTTPIKENPALSTISTTLTTAASTAVEGASKAPVGPLPAPPAPPAPTGSTGGTQ